MFRYLHERYGRDKNLPKNSDNLFTEADVLLRSSFYENQPSKIFISPQGEDYGGNNKITSGTPKNPSYNLDSKNIDDEVTTRYYRQLKSFGDSMGNKESFNENPQFMGDCVLENDNKRRLRILKRKLHQEVYLPNVQMPQTKMKTKKKKLQQKKERKSRKGKSKKRKSHSVTSKGTDTSESDSFTSDTSISEDNSSGSESSSSSTSEESDASSTTTDDNSDSTYVCKKRKKNKKRTGDTVPFMANHDIRSGKCFGQKVTHALTGTAPECAVINEMAEVNVVGENLARAPAERIHKCSPAKVSAQTHTVNIYTCNKEVQSEGIPLVATVESQTCGSVVLSMSNSSASDPAAMGLTLETLHNLRKDADEMTRRLESIMNEGPGEILSRTKSEPPFGEKTDLGCFPTTKSCGDVVESHLKCLEEDLSNIRTFIDNAVRNITNASWLSLTGNNTSGLEKFRKLDCQRDKKSSDIFKEEQTEMRKLMTSHSEYAHRPFDVKSRNLRSPASFQDTSVLYPKDTETHPNLIFDDDANWKNIFPQKGMNSPSTNLAKVEETKSDSRCSEIKGSKMSEQTNNSNFLENLLEFLESGGQNVNTSLGKVLRQKLEEKLANKGAKKQHSTMGEIHKLQNVKENCSTEHLLAETSPKRLYKDFNSQPESQGYYNKKLKSSKEEPLKSRKLHGSTSLKQRENNLERLENNMKKLMEELHRLKETGCLKVGKNDRFVDYSMSDATIASQNTHSAVSLQSSKSKRKWKFWKSQQNAGSSSFNSLKSFKTNSSFSRMLNLRESEKMKGKPMENPAFQFTDSDNKRQCQVIYTNIMRAKTWTVKQVLTWLETQGLSSCTEIFRKAQIDGYHLLRLTRRDIRRLNLGLIHSMRIMSSLKKLKSDLLREMKLRYKDVNRKRK